MRKAISTAGAPAAIGPYSQAIQVGDTLWMSGQIALDPSGERLVGETAADQTAQVLRNMEAVLGAAQFTVGDLVHCTIYLKNMDDFAAVNEVYAAFMPTPPPARATVEVSRLPRDVMVEIGGIAQRI